MTYEEALKVTKVNKRSKFRIVKTEDLLRWERAIDRHIDEIDPIDVMDLETLSHEIMSCRL